MGKFEVIECVIIKNPNIHYEGYHRLIYKVGDCKFRYDMMTEEGNLTEEEFILKVKTEWENTKQ
jgi:hypothetical protein